jgi:D-mannonate dehydratase
MSVIDEMLAHLMMFVEKPSSIFGKFPVCPFAHKARVDNKIQFVEKAFTDADLDSKSDMIETMHKFSKEETYELLMFLHPDKSYSFDDLMKFIEKLQPIANDMDLLVFEGHPDDPFAAGGVRLRAEPTANVQVIRKSTFDAAHTLLTKTKYFDRLSPVEMKQFS